LTTRRWFSGAIALFFLPSVLLTGIPAPSGATFPGVNGRIFYFRHIGGDNEIFSMKPDGSNRTRLTDNSVDDEDLAASPDGKWVVFEREVGGSQFDVFKMRADGTHVKRLTNDPSTDGDPAWAPNGNKIVFKSDRNVNDTLFTMKADGSNEQQISFPEGSYFDGHPRWSPNGDWIAFVRTYENTFETYICFISPNDNDEDCLLSTKFDYPRNPDWSPDSKRVVFEGTEMGSAYTTPNVFVMKKNGSNVVRLTSLDVPATDPTYSPDGEKILFEVFDSPELYRMNSDGFGFAPVTPSGYNVYAPDWSVKP
jgi:TolB protein